MSAQDEETRKVPAHPPDNVAAASDKGPMRKANEDAYALPAGDAPQHLGAIYLVADGVGGQEAGAEAAEIAAATIHDTFYLARTEGDDVSSALKRAIEAANLAIYDEAQAREISRMGCTLVTAVHHDGLRYLAHAGDARAYLLREDELLQLTRDDTWVQRQVEEGLIGEETAAHHELRHVVTRVLGNKPDLEFTVTDPTPIHRDDVMLLCSDGLHDTVSPERIQQILAGYSPQAAADSLVAAANKAGATDNITAVIVSNRARAPEQPTVAMPAMPDPADTGPTPAAAPAAQPGRRQKGGVRLPLWALGLLVLLLLGGLVFGVVALWRSVSGPGTPTPAVVAPTVASGAGDLALATETAVAVPTLTSTPLPSLPPPATATDPAATEAAAAATAPTATSAATTEPTADPASNLACVDSPNALVFVWQDDQISGSNCDQFAREGFVLNDGDQVTVIEATPVTILGPDSTFCQENQFIKVQAVANEAVTGWVLANAIEPATAEQGCPP